MLDILTRIEKEVLPQLLADSNVWKSVYVDYHPPFVERVWAPVELEGVPYRVYLHRIAPCKLEEALFHPHPWPSAMRLLSGRYTMIVGHGAGMAEPPVTMALSLATGTSYEMVDENAWHAVCPEDEAAYSLMVTGAPWQRESHKSTHTLEPLEPSTVAEIFEFFRSIYSVGA